MERVSDLKNNHAISIRNRNVIIRNYRDGTAKEINPGGQIYNAFLNQDETMLYCCFANNVEVYEMKTLKPVDDISIEVNELTIFDIREDFFIGHKRGELYVYNYELNDLEWIGGLAQQKLFGDMVVVSNGGNKLTVKKWDNADVIFEAICKRLVPVSETEFLLCKKNYIEYIDQGITTRYPLFDEVKRIFMFHSFIVTVTSTVKIFDVISEGFIDFPFSHNVDPSQIMKLLINDCYELVICSPGFDQYFDLKTLPRIKLLKIVAHGLESKNNWSTFLTKGLYDPRLLNTIMHYAG